MILITGATGALGRAFTHACETRFLPYMITTREQFPIHSAPEMIEFIKENKPTAIINATGYVSLINAETDVNKCFETNVAGNANISKLAEVLEVPAVMFSSNMVFDGNTNKAYLENNEPNPINIYGSSQFQAEKVFKGLIVRSSAFFGSTRDFTYRIIQDLKSGKVVSAYADVYFTPTYTIDLAHRVLSILGETGIVHLTNRTIVSEYDYANLIARIFKLPPNIEAIPYGFSNSKLKLPIYAPLGTSREFYMPTLEHALERYARIIHDSSKG